MLEIPSLIPNPEQKPLVAAVPPPPVPSRVNIAKVRISHQPANIDLSVCFSQSSWVADIPSSWAAAVRIQSIPYQWRWSLMRLKALRCRSLDERTMLPLSRHPGHVATKASVIVSWRCSSDINIDLVCWSSTLKHRTNHRACLDSGQLSLGCHTAAYGGAKTGEVDFQRS